MNITSLFNNSLLLLNHSYISNKFISLDQPAYTTLFRIINCVHPPHDLVYFTNEIQGDVRGGWPKYIQPNTFTPSYAITPTTSTSGGTAGTFGYYITNFPSPFTNLLLQLTFRNQYFPERANLLELKLSNPLEVLLPDRYTLRYECAPNDTPIVGTCSDFLEKHPANVQCNNYQVTWATYSVYQNTPTTLEQQDYDYIERVWIKGYHPEDDPTAFGLKLGLPTDKYNCIAWSLGITSTGVSPQRWTTGKDAMIDFYRHAADIDHYDPDNFSVWRAKQNYQDLDFSASDATIDAYVLSASNPVIAHATLLFDDPDADSSWGSKLNDNILTQHERFVFQNGKYGQTQVVGFISFKPIGPVGKGFVRLLDLQYTDHQLAYLEEKVKATDPWVIDKFKMMHLKWLEACFKLIHQANSNECSKLKEHKDITALKQDTVPLLISKMLYGENYHEVALYEEVQKDNTDYIVDSKFSFGRPRALATAKKWFEMELGVELGSVSDNLQEVLESLKLSGDIDIIQEYN